MRRILSAIILSIPLFMSAQSAIDAYTMAQTDLKGTARFVSMAGAFGALGGDMSAIQQNAGGIGVYRSSDVGLTLSLDMQTTKSETPETSSKMSQTKFNINSLGYVGSLKLNSGLMPYFNFGVSYHRPLSFNRRYGGKISDLKNSMTNYVASITNSDGCTTDDLEYTVLGNPYEDSYARWLSIMAYNSYIINPIDSYSNGVGYNFGGLMNKYSSGFSEYEMIEEGGINEFDLNIGGNISNVVYWGLGVGVTDVNFNKYTYYGEGINNASVLKNKNGERDHKGTASWGLENWLKTSGIGWNFDFGLIARPYNELRLGLGFHLPTQLYLKDEATATINYETVCSDGSFVRSGYEDANKGYYDVVKYKVCTPWSLNLSAATVVGSKAILSATYERIEYNAMNLSFEEMNGSYVEDPYASNDIDVYYKGVNVFRLGAEYRLLPSVSLRLGYAYQSSPVRKMAIEDEMIINTSGTTAAYTFDKATQYLTAGAGFRTGKFYADIAFVLKMRESEYRAFTPYNMGPSYETNYKLTPAPSATVRDFNSQLVCSVGYRF